MDLKKIKSACDKHGIPMAAEDHPIYSSDATITFVNVSGPKKSSPEKFTDSTQDEVSAQHLATNKNQDVSK